MRVSETKVGCIIEIFVKPYSEEFNVALEDGDIVVHCREEPLRGKVNKEIVKELSRLFHRQVEIVSGFSSRDKKLFVRGAKKSEIETLLGSC
jgi:uncharacterized protein (TIGR00251 family)